MGALVQTSLLIKILLGIDICLKSVLLYNTCKDISLERGEDEIRLDFTVSHSVYLFDMLQWQ